MRDGHLDLGSAPALAAIVLAGGRGRRLGGVDKPMVAVGGVPMLARVVSALMEGGAAPIVVVGPVREGMPAGVRVVREEPAGGGPAAAVGAGIGEVAAGGRGGPPGVGGLGLVAVVAADLPFLSGRAVRVLVDAVGERDGALFVDGDGRRQLLCGVWRVAALVEAVGQMERLEGASLRRLVGGLDVAEVAWAGERPPYFDCDTEDDLRRVGRA
ncbi:molybdenum cofactor guanylyltransferase [Dactylosporangium sp. CA-233914]|uniref:molybdenum cofactor guanylyltransferase n=1 Tax=Dactylosporangium sp. CA-233914 TaxID=3239934 RepID=UPI003D9445F7